MNDRAMAEMLITTTTKEGLKHDPMMMNERAQIQSMDRLSDVLSHQEEEEFANSIIKVSRGRNNNDVLRRNQNNDNDIENSVLLRSKTKKHNFPFQGRDFVLAAPLG